MIGNKKSLASYGVAAGIAMAVCQFAAPAAAYVETGMHKLFNHQDANLFKKYGAPYGLRLDAFTSTVPVSGGCNDDSPDGSSNDNGKCTFSVETLPADTISTATLDWGLGGTDFTKARITGTLHRNDGTASGEDWDVVYDVINIKSLTGANPTLGAPNNAINGWWADEDDITLTLTRLEGGNEVIVLSGKNDGSNMGVVYDDDGHRCGGGPGYPKCGGSKKVLRGWFDAPGTNDWLVVGQHMPTTVPEPGTMALFGLGLLGIGYARRRKVIA